MMKTDDIAEFFASEKSEWTKVDESIDALGKSIDELKNMLDAVLQQGDAKKKN